MLGMNPVEGGKQEIIADVPMSEMFGYNTDLRSMTGGSGEYSYEFARYEQAPPIFRKKKSLPEQLQVKSKPAVKSNIVS